MMTVLCFIFGALSLVLAFSKDGMGRRPWRFGEHETSAQWVIAAAIFFLGAR